MIYIFNFAKEICGLPGLLCTQCSKLFDKCNCTICEDVCMGMANCCRGFLDKPLSSYVVVTGLLSLVELGLCASVLNAAVTDECTVKAPGVGMHIHSWLVIQMGFAGLNLLFAPYFQGRVWQNLLEQVQAAGGLRGKIGKEMVQSSFKHVFLHDFGVLFYFIALVASFFWSWNGSNWGGYPFCNPDGGTANAAWLGMCLFWVAFLYSVSWYWCSCCAKSVDPSSLRDDLEKAGAAPGVPAGDGDASSNQALYYGRGPTSTQGNLVQGGVAPAYQPVATGGPRR